MEFDETLRVGRSQRPLPSLCFSGQSKKQEGRPGLWLAETFSISPLKPLNEIQRNLTGSKISTSSTKFVFFGPIGKKRLPPWPLIGGDIFDFSETPERNSTKLDGKQDLNVLYQVYVFRVYRKNKMAALASDLPRHFWLLLWNRWTEFNVTWQEARSQRPLPSLCFSGRSEKQDGRPGLWLAETFSTFPLKPLNGIQRNLTGSKISTSSTNFVFSGWSEKQDGRPGLWLAETFLTSPLKPLNGIQRNLTGSKISTSSTNFVFSGWSEKQDGRPGLWLNETFSTSLLKPLNGIQQNLTRSKISTSSTKFVFFGLIEKTRWPPWLIRQKRWPIVLMCTICGPLGLFYKLHKSCYVMWNRVRAWLHCYCLNLWKLFHGNCTFFIHNWWSPTLIMRRLLSSSKLVHFRFRSSCQA